MASGDIIFAADFGTPVSDSEVTDETAFTDTAYVPGGNPCGISFTAPTSGIVIIFFGVRFQSNTNNVGTIVSVSVRTGSTLGSGTIISGSSDDSAIENVRPVTGGVQSRMQCSRHRLVTGLTPGSIYNVQVEHKMVSAGNGTVFYRDVAVLPVIVG